MKDDNIISFKPKARIILQLGDQLIRSENIAILELIKNSYDACAKRVIIEMNNIEDPDFGNIIIEDDGSGMDYKIVKNEWLTPGTTFKKVQIESNNFISPCNRIPIGEKGIGRFGAHKLGEEIELISKKEGSKEVYLNINWQNFDNDKMLDSVPINIIERKPEVFKNGSSGTKIIINKLRNKWTRGNVRNLYRAINSLNSPFESQHSFRILFKIDHSDWLEGLVSFTDIKEHALFSAEAVLDGKHITKFKYEFTPWSSLKKLRGRVFEPQHNIHMMQKSLR
jgi:hypothetical protein